MAINIPLVKNYRLLSDRHNWIIAREENGRLTHIGFYSDIESAIESVINIRMREFSSTSIVSLLEAIKTLRTALNKALQPLNIRVVEVKE